MIKANELRLGNMITYGAHGLVIVNEIKASGKIRVTHTEQSSIDLGYIDSLLREVNLDPIPLTEEWLEKISFEKGEKSYSYHTHLRVEKYTSATQGWINNAWRVVLIDSIPYHLCREFHYVHEIQNLWFALTGEELTIKEPA